MAKTAEEKAADKAAKEKAAAEAEEARRAALSQEERDAEDAAAAAKAPKPKSTEPITVKFRDHEGKVQERTFSKEVHGDKFAELAEEFKANPNNRIVTE